MSGTSAVSESVAGRTVQPYGVTDYDDDSVARIRQLEWLSDDWNSYGGLPPTPCAIEQAIAVVLAARSVSSEHSGADCKPSAIGPLPDGGISIVWTGSGGQLDVEIAASGQIGFLFEPATALPDHTVDCDNASLPQLLDRLRHTLIAD